MPRKTKETNEIEETVKSTKSTSSSQSKTTKSTKSSAKKVASKKEDITMSETDAPKTTTKRKTATKKTTTKKADTKSSVSKSATKTGKTKSATAKKTASARTKKATAKKSTTKKSSSVATSKRKTSASTKQKVDVVEYYDLPYRYNQTVVKLLAQTPTNLFIYWDISDADREKYKEQYGENFFETTKPVLIIHNITLDYYFEIDINDFANSWYLHVNDSKCDYEIELGRRPISQNPKIDTDYIYISTSNPIESPNDHILFDEKTDKKDQPIYFRNVKTGVQTERPPITANISSVETIGKIYNIYDIYKALYKEEDIQEIYDLSNPSSGLRNPSSGSLSSKFK